MARSRRGGPKCNVQRHPSGHHARELTNTCSTLDLGFQCIGTFTTPVLSQCHVLQHEGPRRGSAISAAVQVNRVWQQRQVPQGACNCHHATSAARVAMSAIGKKLLLFLRTTLSILKRLVPCAIRIVEATLTLLQLLERRP